MDMKKYFLAQYAAHPSYTAQDMIKQSYQAAFGAEHLISDAGKIRAYLEEEAKTAGCDSSLPLYEYISPDTARVNLAPWSAAGFPLDWLLALFVGGAQEAAQGDRKLKEDAFYRAADDARELTDEGKLPVTRREFDSLFSSLFADGLHAVHHSEIYRETEKPAYRVVSGRYARLLPLFAPLAKLMKEKKPCVLAIDGRAASGKSTVAALLASVTGASLVHMDDFFLPPALRTQERLSEAGGNVDYERFSREVLPVLRKNEKFSYQRFECGEVMALGGFVEVEKSDIIIVEGSYSLHPYFGPYADLKVFSDINSETQMARILARNGEEMAEMFRTRWIPMEEKYFSAFSVKENADIIL